MSIISKCKTATKLICSNPAMFWDALLLNALSYMPDKYFLRVWYRSRAGYWMDFKHPRTFNEKLQWLKLYDRNPLHTTMVDKYAVKNYVANIIGEEYIIPTLGVWDKFDDIDFDALPNQFVLKCTHDSGGLVICADKAKLDKNAARSKIERSLRTDYYRLGREWPYKNVPRRIIAEQYMCDESGTELKDYKIFNFEGKPYLIQVDYGRFTHHKRNMYDLSWNLLDIHYSYESDPDFHIERPKQLATMLHLAETLSKGEHFLRTDFYSISDKIYFGELTLFPDSGVAPLRPEVWGERLGDMLNL